MPVIQVSQKGTFYQSSFCFALCEIFNLFPLIGNADGLMPDPFLEDAAPRKNMANLPAGAAGVAKIFDAIGKQINPELVKSVQAVYLFKVSGTFT